MIGFSSGKNLSCGIFVIRSSPVFGAEFTNVKGIRRRKCIGRQIDLSADFNNLSESIAKSVVSACDADTVTVSYRNPNHDTAVFERPVIEAVPVCGDADGESYWNISLSMTCPLKGDGL